MVAEVSSPIPGHARCAVVDSDSHLNRSVGLRTQLNIAVRSDCHLRDRSAQRGDGIRSELARRTGDCLTAGHVAAEASVIREGRRQKVSAAVLVPGDIMLVEEGDRIAADARLLESTALKTAEAALTGESLPVAKDTAPIPDDALLGDRDNMIFSGTVATYGRGTAVVVATGMETEMGQIAGMLQRTPVETTPLQKQLDHTGKLLGLIVIGVAVVMVATLILAEHVSGFSGIVDALIFGVALAVAAVPEGLPAVVTAVLSLGVQRMARRNAIVRHLAAVETLGSANVIASDKTGTLTRNEMTVRKVITASGSVNIGGTGYAPEGAVTDPKGGPISDAVRSELERVLTIADRANNAVLEREGLFSGTSREPNVRCRLAAGVHSLVHLVAVGVC